VVVPRHGKTPPRERTEQRLHDRERDDVALAQKEPGHHASADESYGNENGIRPVTRGKDPARQKRRKPSLACEKFQAI
jgi:hypothetical protein